MAVILEGIDTLTLDNVSGFLDEFFRVENRETLDNDDGQYLVLIARILF